MELYSSQQIYSINKNWPEQIIIYFNIIIGFCFGAYEFQLSMQQYK